MRRIFISLFFWILSGLALLIILFLEIGIGVIEPWSVQKIIAMLYLLGAGILLFLMLISDIIVECNIAMSERIKCAIYFRDTSWNSYIYFSLLIVPLLCTVICMLLDRYTKLIINMDILIQVIYWSITVASCVWFLWHFHYITNARQQKFKLMIKFSVTVISGFGLLTDIVLKIHFTNQLLVLTWFFLLMSYLFEKYEIKLEQ